LYALILLSIAADQWSSLVRSRRNNPSGRRDRVLVASVVLAVALAWFSWWWVGLDISLLWQGNTWTLAGGVIADALPPTTGGQSLVDLLGLSGTTVAMSIIAITIAFVGGALLAVPSARLPRLGLRHRSGLLGNLLWMVRASVCKLVLVVLRAIPPPVWALLFLFVFYPGVLPGAFALGVYTAGVLGRLMAEATENVDGRPMRALRAHGAAEPLVFCYAVVPAVAPKFVAYGLYRWEVAIRETVVVGVVGAGGLGLLLEQQLASFDYAASLTTVATLIVLTLVVDLGSAGLRRALR
jgi:phosphonate transport system permease protein